MKGSFEQNQQKVENVVYGLSLFLVSSKKKISAYLFRCRKQANTRCIGKEG